MRLFRLLGLLTLTGISTLILLSYALANYIIPVCQNHSLESREEVLQKTPYVHGRVTNITDTEISIRTNFRHLNRLKCASMQAPYRSILGSIQKTYTADISDTTSIVPITDSRAYLLPNDHTPGVLTDPQEILYQLNTIPSETLELNEIQLDDRIVLVGPSAVLQKDSFEARLIFVYPNRIQTYGTISDVVLIALIILLVSFFVEIILHIIGLKYTIIQSHPWGSYSRILIIGGLTLWYLTSYYI